MAEIMTDQATPNPTTPRHEIAHAYRSAFEQLTPDTLDDLINLAAPDIVFTDPFNTAHGRDEFRRVFQHMFDTCEAPQFTVTEIAIGKAAVYMRWVMTGQIKGKTALVLNLNGMSELHFDANGLIKKHIDHWDSASQLLQHLPYIGWITRRILRLFQIKMQKR